MKYDPWLTERFKWSRSNRRSVMWNDKFVVQTIELASKSQCSKHHGALVVKRSKVIGRGVNFLKSHPDWHERQRHSYHAEIVAIKKANGQIEGSTVYSFRDAPWKNSRPCEGCIDRMRRLGVRSMVYVAATTSPLGPFRIVSERL